jgi:hypothetical protein
LVKKRRGKETLKYILGHKFHVNETIEHVDMQHSTCVGSRSDKEKKKKKNSSV